MQIRMEVSEVQRPRCRALIRRGYAAEDYFATNFNAGIFGDLDATGGDTEGRGRDGNPVQQQRPLELGPLELAVAHGQGAQRHPPQELALPAGLDQKR